MNRRTHAAWIVGLLLAVGTGSMSADAQYQWPFSVQAQTGQEAHWTSPSPVDTGYPRYYSRVDSHVKVDAWVMITWVTVMEEDRLDFGEMVGAIPPGGLLVLQEHMAETGEGYAVEADVTIWVDGSGYFHVDVTNFQSTPTLRITVTGTLRVEATDTVYGDYTGDGIVDGLDLVGCARCLAGSDPLPGGLAPFDLDSSGVLDTRDLALMQNFVAGNLATAYIDWSF